MNRPATVNAELFENIGTLRNLLDLLTSLRELSDPFASADALRNGLNLLTRAAETFGINPNWLAWLQSVLSNPQRVELVLAIGRYLETLLNTSAPAAPATNPPTPPQSIRLAVVSQPNETAVTQSGAQSSAAQSTMAQSATVQSLDFMQWITLVGSVLQLIQKLRGTKPAS